MSNPNHAETAEVRANLEAAITAARREAQAECVECVSVFAGMAGVTTEQGRQFVGHLVRQCGLGHARVGVDHDIRISSEGWREERSGLHEREFIETRRH